MNESKEDTKHAEESASHPADCSPPPSSLDVTRYIESRKGDDGYWSGDAYGYHPVGVIFENLLLVDEWHCNGYATIYLKEDEDSAWECPASGRDASVGGSKYHAIPRPITGKLRTIFGNGRWVKGANPDEKNSVMDLLANTEITRGVSR